MSGDDPIITVSATAPSNPDEGDEWFQKTTDINYIAVKNDATNVIEWKQVMTEAQRNAPQYVELTDLSTKTNDADNASLIYNNVTGSFTYTPPVVPSVSNLALTSSVPSELLDLGITDGSNSEILYTDGSGNFSFSAPSINNNSVSVYNTQASMPLTGHSIGDLAFAEDTDRMFLWNNGWYMVSTTGTVDLTGSAIFTTTGASTFTVPADITSICVLCVGAGGAGGWFTNPDDSPGGGGGGLAYANNISVSPGQVININVGAGGTSPGGNGGDTWFNSDTILNGKGGEGGKYNGATGRYNGGNGGASQGSIRTGGGSGGNGGIGDTTYSPGGGGGAGGYAGNGGNGANSASNNTDPVAGQNAPAGGGGGGGSTENNDAGGGGGVGIYGQGASGSGGTASVDGDGGKGGSGGENGSSGVGTGANGAGGIYGGGGAGGEGAVYLPGDGADGVIRVIWGSGREFPSTNVSQSSSYGNETTY